MTRKHIPAMLKAEERSFRRNDIDTMSLYYYDEEMHEKTIRQEGFEEVIRQMMKFLKKKKFSNEEILSDLPEEFPDHADSVKRVLESL